MEDANRNDRSPSELPRGFETETDLQVGDRVEVFPGTSSSAGSRLYVPEAISFPWAGEPEVVIQDPQGGQAVARFDPATRSLIFPHREYTVKEPWMYAVLTASYMPYR